MTYRIFLANAWADCWDSEARIVGFGIRPGVDGAADGAAGQGPAGQIYQWVLQHRLIAVRGLPRGFPGRVIRRRGPAARLDRRFRLAGRLPCSETLLYEVVLIGRGLVRVHLGLRVCDRFRRDGESRSGHGLCFKEGARSRADRR